LERHGQAPSREFTRAGHAGLELPVRRGG